MKTNKTWRREGQEEIKTVIRKVEKNCYTRYFADHDEILP
jgi:hypothetical protein